MSALVLPTLEEVVEATAGRAGRAGRKTGAANGDAGADRRAYPRLRPEEVRWLRRIRLKNGPEVTLVDLSIGGALIDTRVQIRPGSSIILELSGARSVLEVTSEVLRSRLNTLERGAAIYRGACAFSEPFTLDALARSPLVEPVESAPAATLAWQKIVVRYREGGTLKGYTLDFHPSRGHFSLWPSVNARAGERVIVPLVRLKALFFVRDFAGNAAHVAPASFQGAAPGRKIEVTFFDREVVRGTTLNYRPEAVGFFVTPVDGSENNQRVFVINGAVRHVRFP
jgi:hypothetical protein